MVEKDKQYMEDLEKRSIKLQYEIEQEIPNTKLLTTLPPDQIASFLSGVLSEPLIVELKIRIGENIRVKMRSAQAEKESLLSEAAHEEKQEGILVEVIECTKCHRRGLQKPGRIVRKCCEIPMVVLGRVWWDPLEYPPNTAQGNDWVKNLKFEPETPVVEPTPPNV